MEIGLKEWEESRWETSRLTGFVLRVVEMRSRQGNTQESRWKKQRKSGQKQFRQKVQSAQTRGGEHGHFKDTRGTEKRESQVKRNQ